jgi:hypothetical protein
LIDNTLNKEEVSQLKVDFSPYMKSVACMDKFDGVNSDKSYSQLIIKRYNTFYRPHNISFVTYNLVIERVKTNEKIEGKSYTFTQIKNKEDCGLNYDIYKQIPEEIIDEYLCKDKIFYLKSPIMLNAQNSSNRTGYGQTWDWSISADYPIDEGTQYGETTTYKIVGIYLIK